MFNKDTERTVQFLDAHFSFPGDVAGSVQHPVAREEANSFQSTRSRSNSSSAHAASTTSLQFQPSETKIVRVHVRVEVVMKALQMLLGLHDRIHSRNAKRGKAGHQGKRGSYVDALFSASENVARSAKGSASGFKEKGLVKGINSMFDSLSNLDPHTWWEGVQTLTFSAAAKTMGRILLDCCMAVVWKARICALKRLSIFLNGIFYCPSPHWQRLPFGPQNTNGHCSCGHPLNLSA